LLNKYTSKTTISFEGQVYFYNKEVENQHYLQIRFYLCLEIRLSEIVVPKVSLFHFQKRFKSIVSSSLPLIPYHCFLDILELIAYSI